MRTDAWAWSLFSLLVTACPASLQAQGGEPEKPGNAESQDRPVAPVPSSEVDPTKDTYSLTRDATAPFTGILLRDMRFAELRTAELRLEATTLKLVNANKAYEDTKAVANACAAELGQLEGPAWYVSVEFWGGVVVGVGTSLLVGWLGYELDVF